MRSLSDLSVRENHRLGSPPFDVERFRQDFPILRQLIHGKPLVYLDNAATSQKPQAVLDTLLRYYSSDNSNIHRGVHLLSQRATDSYEASRQKVRKLINAAEASEIIFVRGTTEAINLVAQTIGRSRFKRGDEILVSAMEHHSNIVPWQILAEQTGAVLKVAPINDRGEVILEEFDRLLNPKTRLVSMVHLSNALGTLNPIREIVEMAHREGALVLVDAAQSVPHISVDVRELNCDFLAFSGHKLFGPTGVGVLYGKRDLLEDLPPYQGGGDMIASVSFEKTTYNILPHRFEAGTPNIAGVVGLGAAIDYIGAIGMAAIEAYENELLSYATEAVGEIPNLRIIGTASRKAGVLSFVIEDIHPHDIGTILDQEGIAIRTGHHCAQPVMDRFAVPATARVSFAFYNVREEIDALVAGLRKVVEIFN